MTELGVVRDMDAASRFAQVLRGAGASFAMGGFGPHGDAFRCLQLLKPGYVKLNRALFRDLATDREDQFFIPSIVKIARPLLQSLGVDGYQGYASGKPTRIA